MFKTSCVGAVIFAFAVLQSVDAQASNCIPGAQSQCACPGGGTGVQVCSDDGARLGACSSCVVVQTQPQPMMSTPMYMPMPARPQMRRRSPGIWGGGLALMLVGAVFTPIGTGLVVYGAADGSCHHHNDDTVCEIGGSLLGLGLLSLGGGITMMIIGGHKVPNDAPQAWWVPTPMITPRGGSLTWSF